MDNLELIAAQLIEAAQENGCSAVGVKEVSDDAIAQYCSLDVAPLYGNVMSVHNMIEKPKKEQIMSNFAILGRYVLTPDIFDILEHQTPGYGGEIQLTDALACMARTSKMVAVDFAGRRFDTGSLNGYLEAMIELSLLNPKSGEWLRNYILERAKTL